MAACMTNNREIPCPKCGEMVPCDSERCKYCGALMDCAEVTLVPGLNSEPYSKVGSVADEKTQSYTDVAEEKTKSLSGVAAVVDEKIQSFSGVGDVVDEKTQSFSGVGDVVDEGGDEKTQFDISAYNEAEGDEECTRLNIEAMDVPEEKPVGLPNRSHFFENAPNASDGRHHVSGEKPRHPAADAGEETGLCKVYDDKPAVNVKKIVTGLLVGLLVIASLGIAGYGVYYYLDSLEDDEPVHKEIKAPVNHEHSATHKK